MCTEKSTISKWWEVCVKLMLKNELWNSQMLWMLSETQMLLNKIRTRKYLETKINTIKRSRRNKAIGSNVTHEAFLAHQMIVCVIIRQWNVVKPSTKSWYNRRSWMCDKNIGLRCLLYVERRTDADTCAVNKLWHVLSNVKTIHWNWSGPWRCWWLWSCWETHAFHHNSWEKGT